MLIDTVKTLKVLYDIYFLLSFTQHNETICMYVYIYALSLMRNVTNTINGGPISYLRTGHEISVLLI